MSAAKRRPAFVAAELPGGDVILCQITSRTIGDGSAILIRQSDFAQGGLRQDSHVRPNRLFTADSKLILYQAGKLKAAKVDEIIAKIVEIVRS